MLAASRLGKFFPGGFMRDDLVTRLERVYEAIGSLESVARLLSDGRVVGATPVDAVDVSNVVTVLAETISDRLDLVNGEVRDKVLPFYRDFLQAKEAMSRARA
ncbi:hypothetical protein [Ralstonia sp. GP101]|uniref:hypothetical protein n=1 Tax=Ralstonia sp. GP101 TaxID=3035146 RepID=UPI0038917A7E